MAFFFLINDNVQKKIFFQSKDCMKEVPFDKVILKVQFCNIVAFDINTANLPNVCRFASNEYCWSYRA